MQTFVVSFFIGTLSVLFLPRLPEFHRFLWVYSGLLLLFLVVGMSRRRHVFAWYGVLCVGLVLGSAYAVFSAIEHRSHWLPPELEGVPLALTGRIVSLPEYTPMGVNFDFQVLGAESVQGTLKVHWYARSVPNLKAGESWQFTLSGKRPSGLSNPNGFDYEKWLFSERIIGSAMVKSGAPYVRLTEAAWWFPDTWRQRIRDRMQAVMGNSPVLGLMQGLAIADTSQVSVEQWQVLRDTGTIHLLAISGLHITMVAAMGFVFAWGLGWVVPSVYTRVPARVVGSVVGGCLATGYVVLAGFNVPSQRTLIMLLVLMLSVMLRQVFPFKRAFAVALFLVLLWDPLACLSVGFWLSFATVGVLVWLGSRQLVLSKLGGIWIQVALSIMTIPLTAGFFGMVSWGSPAANLVAIPVVTFLVTPLVLLGVVLSALSDALASGCWQLASWMLDALMMGLTALASVPWATQVVPLLPWYCVALALLGIVVLSLPRGLKMRWLGGIFVLPMLLYRPPTPAWGGFELGVIDVGQGLASVIRTQQHTLVFDTGAKTSESFDMGKMAVLPWLHGQGILQINTLILSHADNDHSGGAASVVAGIPVSQVLSSNFEVLPMTTISACVAGQTWQWDGVTFIVLHPSAAFHSTQDNDNSCVLRVYNAHHSVLLTGDIERAAETEVIKQNSALASEVLIVGHHGSKHSSSAAFLNAVQPHTAIISSGYRNRFHHPHTSVLERLNARNIEILSTVDSGAMRLFFPPDAQQIQSEKWRKQHPHIWQR